MKIKQDELVDSVRAELLHDEAIEWTGRPNPSVVFHADDSIGAPFTLLWGGFAILWTLGASGTWSAWSQKPGSSGFQTFGVIWGTPFVLVGQYMIWGRYFYDHWMKKRTVYVLTNRRAMIIRQGVWGRAVLSVFYTQLDVIDKSENKKGMGLIKSVRHMIEI